MALSEKRRRAIAYAAWLGTVGIVVSHAFAALGQARAVVDMRFPPPGSSRFNQVAFWDWGVSMRHRPVFVGDVDGDGYGDFLVEKASEELFGPAELVRLVYGASDFPRDLPLARTRHSRLLYDCVGGEPIWGCPGIHPASWGGAPFFGFAGDVDGDGFDDFLVGSGLSGREGVKAAGRALLVFGARDFPEEVRLGDLRSGGVRSVCFVENPPAPNAFGASPIGCGDLNGDGALDLAFAAPDAPGSEDGLDGGGRVYVVYGGFPLGGEIDVSRVGRDLAGFALHGAHGADSSAWAPDRLGSTIVGAGDLNGDGFDDMLVSAPTAKRGGLRRCGAVLAVFGGPSIPGELFAARPEAFGVEFHGAEEMDEFGSTVATTGDVDGDGLSDFAVGAPTNS